MRQFQDLDIAKVDFRSLRLHAEVAFPQRRPADAIHEFAVDGKLDNAIYTHNVVGVPLTAAFAAVFNGLAPVAAGIVWNRHNPSDAEKFPVNVGEWRWLSVLLVEVDPIQLENP